MPDHANNHATGSNAQHSISSFSHLAVNTMSIDAICTAAYDLWTTLCTSCVMAVLREKDQYFIASLETQSVHRHQDKYFFPGMEKLNLLDEPNDVIKCAKYHFFSNSLGGLPMHYVEETPNKVWIRYLAPYWMGDGPTLPAAGPAVLGAVFGRAPYLGWHAYNGSYLKNDRLTFVQTQSLCDGDPWDGGYFTLHDKPMPAGKAIIRRVGEWGPPPSPETTPQLPHADWPEERRVKALRNYAIDFTTSRYATLSDMIGPAAAAKMVEHSWLIVLSQRSHTLPKLLGFDEIRTAEDAAAYFASVAIMSGDKVALSQTENTYIVDQLVSRLWRSEAVSIPEIDTAIYRAWSKSLALFNPHLQCDFEPSATGGRWSFREINT